LNIIIHFVEETFLNDSKMTLNVPNWKHKIWCRVNTDGAEITYQHTEMPWEASIVGMICENEDQPFDFQYYTVIHKSTFNPRFYLSQLIESPQFFIKKENAMSDLESKMHKHS